MTRPVRPFSALSWTPGLAGIFGEAMSAIGRLDARISASPVAEAWRSRASWYGYATALRLQRYEIDEIDAFSHTTQFAIAGRKPVATAQGPFEAYPNWLLSLQQRNQRHWREGLPFSFDPPDSWSEAPRLIRALTLLDVWSRKDESLDAWLAFPHLLARLELTETPLPCLVVGDSALRTLFGPRERQLKRLLTALRNSSSEGLLRLERLEKWRLSLAAVLADERRPGLLPELGRLALVRPLMSARSVSDALEITLSGAGKLLARAASKGLLVEVSGRASWRVYVTPDIGLALGMINPARGRPPSPPRPSTRLDAVLEKFDREMVAIDSILGRDTSVSSD